MPAFKVIVVGAGPVGLVAGHCLTHAGIEFEILERRDDFDLNAGASTALWPDNVRVLDQLGLLDEARTLRIPYHSKICIRSDGSQISRSRMLAAVEELHGHPWMLFHRGELVDLLRRRLPESSTRIHTGKVVQSIQTNDKGITVTCADDTTHTGSMILGVDGVNSTIRRLIASQPTVPAAQKPSNTTPRPPPMKSSYVGLYGHSAYIPGAMEEGCFYETHARDMTFQVGVAAPTDKCYFACFKRLPHPTTAQHTFTDSEKDAFAASLADVHATTSLTFRELYARAQWSHMAYIEEGVATSPWSSDRIVLAGDAAHKMTPNAGLGLNCGIQSVVVLVNQLRWLLVQKPDSEPGEEALMGVFRAYEAERRKPAAEMVKLSATAMRAPAWRNRVWRFVDQYVLPRIGGDMLVLRYVFAMVVREGVPLDFLEERAFKEGTNGVRVVLINEFTVTGVVPV
ncbi:FAD binding domain-containing protein [Podospora appendiculata]|uniref:FAD binding domain-containing protein n=1 Tax=Podospora appendiculata TaxID=314037 RepID=A0AAE1C8L2_9PEZI|nr:FAD binding domain-containing protein [Podospora appendiculata]